MKNITAISKQKAMLAIGTVALLASNIAIWHKVSAENCTKTIQKANSTFYVKNTAVKLPDMPIEKPYPILLKQGYRDKMYQLLQVFVDTCRALKIPVWVSGGTLLGLTRQGTLLSWDDDIDLHTFEQFRRPFFKGVFANTFKEKGVETFLLKGNSEKLASTPGSVVRFRLKDTKSPVLDLLFCTKKNDLICKIDNWSNDDQFTLNKKEQWPCESLFPLKNQSFLHLTNIPVPQKPEDLLKKQYGPDVLSSIKARYVMFSHNFPYKMLPYIWKVL